MKRREAQIHIDVKVGAGGVWAHGSLVDWESGATRKKDRDLQGHQKWALTYCESCLKSIENEPNDVCGFIWSLDKSSSHTNPVLSPG